MDARRYDRDPMSVEEFLDWHQYQEERYELVQGTPVRMMAGARQDHNVATMNVAAALLPFTRKRGCRTTSSDTAVRTVGGGVRYPDIVVDCGPADPSHLAASEPVLVVEVASPSTRDIDLVDKVDEYKAIQSIIYVLLIEPAVINVTLHARENQGWRVSKFYYLDDEIELPELGARLTVASIYEDLSPEPRTVLQSVALDQSQR